MIGGGLVNRKINGDQSHVKQIGGISSAAISLDRLRRVYVTSALSVLASTPEAIDGLGITTGRSRDGFAAKARSSAIIQKTDAEM